MKILAIRGYNIASLEGEFEIDFTKEPLLSSGIYAITGPTGAGKSTILDALSLALYEDTPRLTKAGEVKISDIKDVLVGVNNPSTLLRRGATEAYAEVDFIANDGDTYRSRWSVRRGHSKVHNPIQPSKVTLINLTTQQEFPEKKKGTLAEITRLVGLTYDQFTRTVLLAQGEFAVFLKANDNERASLLEKLTGTSIYTRISMKIYANTEAARREYEDLQIRMKEHHLLSEDELVVLQQNLEDILFQITQLDNELSRLSHLLAWFTDDEKYISQIQSASQDLQNYKEQLIKEESNSRLLADIASVEPSFSFLRDKQKLQRDQLRLTNEKEELNKDLVTQSQSLKDAEKKADQAEKLYQSFFSKEKQYFDKIQKAHAIHSHLKAQEERFERENTSYMDLRKVCQTKKSQLDEAEQTLRQLSAEQEKLKEWIDSNSDRREVAENHNLIVHHLSQAAQYHLRIKELTDSLDSESLKIEQYGADECLWQQQEKDYVSQLRVFEEEKKKIASQLQILNFDQLRQTSDKYTLESLWNKINPSKKEFQNNEGVINDLVIFFEESKIQKANLEKLQAEQQQVLMQAERSYSRIQQAANENIAAIRTSLQAEQPCPVCGSLHHPYQDKENDHFRLLLDQTKEELDGFKAKLAKTDRSLAELNGKIDSNQEKIKALQTRNKELSEQIKIDAQAWSKNPLADCYDLQDSSFNGNLLVEVISNLDKDIDQCNKDLNKADECKKQLDSLQAELQKCQTSYDQLRGQMQKNKQQLELAENTRTGIRKQVAEYTSFLHKELESVDSYFKNSVWRENWAKDPQSFLSKIKEFSTTWVSTSEALEKARKDCDQLRSTLSIEKKHFDDQQRECARLEGLCGTIRTEIIEIQKSLTDLLDGRTIENVESAYHVEKDNLTNDRERSLEIVRSQKEKVANLTGQSRQLEIQQDKNEQNLAEVIRQFTEWLDHFNQKQPYEYTEDRISQLMETPSDWIQLKKKQLADIDREIVRAESSLKTHQANRQLHLQQKKSELTKEEVYTALKEIRDKKEQADHKRMELQAIWKHHQENTARLADMSATLELKKTNYQNWSALNVEIGKADGAKFKNIAQGYTLELLLQIANAHIRTIAPRYRLQRIPDSLSLQVIDRDMCDQIRSVHSLSGGETFLVSLSLALALSSLSSRQMNIESLFIDEGFGSLDEDSLLTAMDALESLRLQGRKVGVITHVKEMTERISTRIRVIRQQNGSSRIVVE